MQNPASLQKLKYFALDMDGTIYLGQKLLPGAKEFLDYLAESGRKYVFLTNNSSKNKQSYVNKLQKLGLDATVDQVLTSGEATALYIKTIKPNARIFLLGTPDLEQEFIAHGFTLTGSTPDFVVLGFDQTLTYAKLTEACHLIREGVPLIATHPDINCPTDERSGYIPDVGAMLELIYASTGKKAKIIGKPYQEIINALLAKLHCKRDETAMVGDRLYTDIKLAENAAICGILVLSGETKQTDLNQSKVRPNYVFDSVRELAAALQQK
ncbi:HAD-IIA family hydrolase [Sporomusa acidovorans]|uniref:Acid sugar phosphatase n=1 Tax=Sporomusa acidovorans (strain ATCC 49682 / DSM 3132 / Mol) TaxID=1123286 RepID=A0ABZ3J3A2_SPOA4|nr:HAD-IIA family hydrolase [Sporomusa acidovorans]OZC15765.1 putative hydrolase YutF [Sporomusa acidovorans DSM 3132]SDF63060.1 NagD protein [Sporomusa acidovorans]